MTIEVLYAICIGILLICGVSIAVDLWRAIAVSLRGRR